MEQFKSLLQPRSLDEHHAAFLFCDFCDYTLAINGGTVNIKKPGVARLMYLHLVHWFETVGKTYFPKIKNFNDAEFTMFCNTGISEWQDLREIFSPKNAKVYSRTGYPVPFTVSDEETDSVIIPEIVAKSDEDIEKTKAVLEPPKKRGRPRKIKTPDTVTVKPVEQKEPVAEPASEPTPTVEVPKIVKQKRKYTKRPRPAVTVVPVDAAEPRPKRKYTRRKNVQATAQPEPVQQEVPVTVEEPKPLPEIVDGTIGAKLKKKRTHVHNQHIGIIVPDPIIPRDNMIDDNYFILHGKPQTGDMVYAYPCEPEKSIKDYNYAKLGSSWGDPYLYAIRHDYVKRTGCKITDVRKFTLKNWRNRGHKKYITDLRNNEVQKQKEKKIQ